MEEFGDDDIHVWFARPDRADSPELTERYVEILSAGERARHRRFLFEHDRHHFLVAHALLRTTLSRYADVEPAQWAFHDGPHGRPEIASPLEGPRLRFNLSHTRGLVAVAVTLGADIGVDVEGRRERDTNLDVARRFFAPAEVRHLESVASGRQPQVFLEFWTLKEAYIKATGEGLSADLSSFAMQLSDPPTIAFANGNQAAADEWHFRRLHLTNAHVASLAVRRHGMAPAVVVREVVPTVP